MVEAHGVYVEALVHAWHEVSIDAAFHEAGLVDAVYLHWLFALRVGDEARYFHVLGFPECLIDPLLNDLRIDDTLFPRLSTQLLLFECEVEITQGHVRVLDDRLCWRMAAAIEHVRNFEAFKFRVVSHLTDGVVRASAFSDACVGHDMAPVSRVADDTASVKRGAQSSVTFKPV